MAKIQARPAAPWALKSQVTRLPGRLFRRLLPRTRCFSSVLLGHLKSSVSSGSVTWSEGSPRPPPPPPPARSWRKSISLPRLCQGKSKGKDGNGTEPSAYSWGAFLKSCCLPECFVKGVPALKRVGALRQGRSARARASGVRCRLTNTRLCHNFPRLWMLASLLQQVERASVCVCVCVRALANCPEACRQVRGSTFNACGHQQIPSHRKPS